MFSDVWRSSDGVNWTLVTENAPWGPRLNHVALVYNDRLWVLGGWDNVDMYSDVWHSKNGVDWTEATGEVPWSPRIGAGFVVFDNYMWILGGRSKKEMFNDAWRSQDGINWEEVAPGSGDIWSIRSHHGAVVFDDKIWVLSGVPLKGSYSQEIWFTNNGSDWILENGGTGWPGSFISSFTVHDSKIWKSGGFDDGGWHGDVWYGALE